MILGIDASNLRTGGSQTHIVEVLSSARPKEHGFEQVVIWAGRATAGLLGEIASTAVRVVHVPMLDRSLFWRTWWQQVHSTRAARRHGCSLLFNPGCGYVGTFRPYVTMCRNMLSFAPDEVARYGSSGTGFLFRLLRRVHRASFQRANGIIFLNDYARSIVTRELGLNHVPAVSVPHGVHPKYLLSPRRAEDGCGVIASRPMKLLYVSTVDHYKHHWNVVEGVRHLRDQGKFVTLDMVGRALPSALEKLRHAIHQHDPRGQFARYVGPLYGDDLVNAYHTADLFVFASTCENLPNILIEAMAAGLPIVCSNYSPMPEVLGGAGLYFDPLKPAEIAAAVTRMIESPSLRNRLALDSSNTASQYSWPRCAEQTFGFLAGVARRQA